jgi:hypothetical protein
MKRFLLASLVVAMVSALLASTAGSWTNVYGTDGANDYSSAEAVELLPDGSAIVIGCFAGTFNGQTSTNGLDTFVMKVSPEGETLWIFVEDGPHQQDCRTFGEDPGNILGDLITDDAGNIFLFDSRRGIDGLQVLDADGSALPFDPPAVNARKIFPAAEGFAVLDQDQEAGPFALRQVSAAGEIVWSWEPTYPEGYGIDGYARVRLPRLNRPDGEGGYIIAYRHEPALSFQQTDLAVYRIGPDGTELWSTLINGSCISDGDWSFVSDGMIVLDSPSCADSSEQAARVLSLETGAVITDYDEATLRGDSMREGFWPESDCFEVNEAKTLVVFLYDRCDSDLPPEDSPYRHWAIPMQYSVDEFADLGDGRVAALVNLINPELHDDSDPYSELPGRWFGVFEVVADGFLRPLKFEQIVSTNGENDSLRDVAVDPVSGRVVVVGRVAGESSVTLNSLSRSGSVRSSQPNALTVSASSEVVPITHGFDDVALSGWRNDAVYWMRSSGVTTGCSATEFCPDQEMTREQQITFLWRYAGEPSPGASSPFSDVEAGRYFTNPVTWAYNNGITNGVSPTSFGTGQAITRAQAVTFLHRQAGEPAPTVANPFVDVPAGTYYTDPVRWAFENGITTGTSPTTFDPNQAVTRVQFAAFLSRYDNLMD